MEKITYNNYYYNYLHHSIRMSNDKVDRIDVLLFTKNTSKNKFKINEGEYTPLTIYKWKLSKTFLKKVTETKDSFLNIIETKQGNFYICYGYIGIEESDVISYKIDDFETLIQILTYADIPNSSLEEVNYEQIKAIWRDKQIDSILND